MKGKPWAETMDGKSLYNHARRRLHGPGAATNG
jgi:hypothetical protein